MKYSRGFSDHRDGIGTVINPRSILQMRVERANVSWNELRFKPKSQVINHSTNAKKILSGFEVSKTLSRIRTKKALNMARVM